MCHAAQSAESGETRFGWRKAEAQVGFGFPIEVKAKLALDAATAEQRTEPKEGDVEPLSKMHAPPLNPSGSPI
ncbi:MAG: hypothetical protein ABSH49_34210 [Bryobacteraceae bacterium]|jgi:hypothetical protein